MRRKTAGNVCGRFGARKSETRERTCERSPFFRQRTQSGAARGRGPTCRTRSATCRFRRFRRAISGCIRAWNFRTAAPGACDARARCGSDIRSAIPTTRDERKSSTAPLTSPRRAPRDTRASPSCVSDIPPTLLSRLAAPRCSCPDSRPRALPCPKPWTAFSLSSLPTLQIRDV